METSIFVERRRKFLEAHGSGVAVFPSAPIATRNNDVEHEYRQDSDLFYLTGFEEPESVLVLTDRHPEHRAVMFLRVRDPERETWDGPRLGVERAAEALGIDAAFPIEELAERLPQYIADSGRLHYRYGLDAEMDRLMMESIGTVRAQARKGVLPPREIRDTAFTVHEARLIKHEAELTNMRRAAEISAEAHRRAMEVARPGVYEFEVEAEILRTFRAHGSQRPAYGSIVGSGVNATILHYRVNDRRMEDGDLLLIDAGCEYGYYASDITRTFPVNGRFTDAQRAVYEVVLAAQEAAIAACRPGTTVDQVHAVAVEALTAGMVRIGLLSGDPAVLAGEEKYKQYYMHRTSHWLGMDVHDVGAYFIDGKSRALEAGMVLTVEPGIYIRADADAPARFRGIGIRIEDDVVVTPGEPTVLTKDVPKKPDEIERLMRDRT